MLKIKTMNLLGNKAIIPALMFHSVGMEHNNLKWNFSFISEPFDIFKKKITLLNSRNYNPVFWHETYDYLRGKITLPNNSIMLTFDDGYLDNWVFVFPLLKKYGLKATIFINPSFVDYSSKIRKNLDDVWEGTCVYNDLEKEGFLSWDEMRAMESSGLIDIQSHSLTHTWYFTSPKIVDFHHHKKYSPYPWLLWNEFPLKKPFYLTENLEKLLPYGYPIFEHQKSLLARQYYPDQNVIGNIINHVNDGGAEDFFDQPTWKEDLLKYCQSLNLKDNSHGTYESKINYCIRIKTELAESKRLIEVNLGKQVDYLCWPGGGCNNKTISIARDIGYKAWTLPSTGYQKNRNIPGSNHEHLKRIGTRNYIKLKNNEYKRVNNYYQLLNIKAHQGSPIHKILKKLFQSFYTGVGIF